MAEEENQQQSKPPPEELNESTPVLPRSYGNLPGGNTDPRKTWPELVGLTAEEGERKIKEDMPAARVQVVPSNSFVTMDFNLGRVRIYVDSTGRIERPPRVG